MIIGYVHSNGSNIFLTILTILIMSGLTVLLFYSVKKERINYKNEIAELIEGVLKKSEITASINNYISHSPSTLVFSLILIEYDKFMELQNAFGNDNSKKILEESTKNIRKILPARSQFGRISEDRFLLLVKEDYDKNEILRLANKIKDSASQGIKVYADTVVNATVSVGVAFYPTHGKRLRDLMKSLDLAVFSAKNNGGNAVSLYSDQFDKEDIDNLQFYYEVKEAIKEHQFILYYQPIINLKDNTVYGLEALLRWNHPTLGVLPPSSFINILEQSGDINVVGVWGIETLIKEYIELRKTFIHKDLQLSFNLSPKQLLSDTLGVTFQRIAKKYKIPVDHITIEIVEFAMFETHDIVNKNINNLKEIGFKVAVDGFGLDQNTLAKLEESPIDIIKLDRTFLSEEESYLQTKYMELLIDFAKKTNKLIVCEGIEDIEGVNRIKKYGVNYAQGYFFSKPLPQDKIHEYIAREKEISDLMNPDNKEQEVPSTNDNELTLEAPKELVEDSKKPGKNKKRGKKNKDVNDEKVEETVKEEKVEEPTEETVEEEKVEESAIEVKTEETVEEVKAEESTEETVTEEKVEEPVTEEQPVEEPAIEVKIEESTEEKVEEPVTEEQPVEEPVIEDAKLEEDAHKVETVSFTFDDNQEEVKPVETNETENDHEVKTVSFTFDDNNVVEEKVEEKAAKKKATTRSKTTTKKTASTKKEPSKSASSKKKTSSNNDSLVNRTTKKVEITFDENNEN